MDFDMDVGHDGHSHAPQSGNGQLLHNKSMYVQVVSAYTCA